MSLKKVLLFVLAMGFGCFCYEGMAMDKQNIHKVKDDTVNIAQYIDKSVILKGIAYNAKLGAILDINGIVVYIEGLTMWQEEYIGKKLNVTGLLVKGKNYKTNDNTGIAKSGIEGDYFIIKNANWEYATN